MQMPEYNIMSATTIDIHKEFQENSNNLDVMPFYIILFICCCCMPNDVLSVLCVAELSAIYVASVHPSFQPIQPIQPSFHSLRRFRCLRIQLSIRKRYLQAAR